MGGNYCVAQKGTVNLITPRQLEPWSLSPARLYTEIDREPGNSSLGYYTMAEEIQINIKGAYLGSG